MQWIKNQGTVFFLLFLFMSSGYAAQTDTQNPSLFYNVDLVRLSSTQTTGTWNPLPGTPISVNNQSQGTFLQSGTSPLEGSVTYGLAEFCSSGSCDPQYQFTLNIRNRTCDVVNGGFLTVSLLEPSLVEGVLTCNVYASLQAEPGSPHMSVTIYNQIGRAPGSGTYSYALDKGQSELAQGIFTTEVPVRVDSGQSSSTIGLTALKVEGEYSKYQGKIIYAFNDATVAGAPTGLEIDINNIDGVECAVSVTGWNEGYRIYDVKKSLTGGAGNAVCTIEVTSEDNPNEPVDYIFNQIATLKTDGISQWETFQIANDTYLLAANANAATTAYFGSNLFRYNSANPNKFDAIQQVVAHTCQYGDDYTYLRDHTNDWHHFKIGTQDWFLLANNFSNQTDLVGYKCFPDNPVYWDTLSYIFKWDYDNKIMSFSNYLTLKTDTAIMSESYTMAGNNFIAVVQGYKAGIHQLSIYEMEDSLLIPIEQGITLQSPNHLEAFYANGQTYLVISQIGAAHETQVYKVGADGKLALYQGAAITPTHTINPAGYTQNSLVFTISGVQYLALGYAPNQTGVVPQIYRWESSAACGGCYLFVPIQNQELPASFANVQNWAHYQVNGKDFLAAALGTQGAQAYRWNPKLGELETAFSYGVWGGGDNIVGLTTFTINGAQHLALAKNKDNAGNLQTVSPILRWDIKN